MKCSIHARHDRVELYCCRVEGKRALTDCTPVILCVTVPQALDGLSERPSADILASIRSDPYADEHTRHPTTRDGEVIIPLGYHTAPRSLSDVVQKHHHNVIQLLPRCH